SSLSYLVRHILSRRSDPNILTTIVQAVAIFVIDPKTIWRIQQHAMHQDAPAIFIPGGVGMAGLCVDERDPSISSYQLHIADVDSRLQPLGEGYDGDIVLNTNG